MGYCKKGMYWYVKIICNISSKYDYKINVYD